MSEVATGLAEVEEKIAAACERTGRDRSVVTLVAVSKTFPVDSIREAIGAGQLHFGESKLQEAEPKIEALAGKLHWHFIGRVQRNKVRKILSSFEIIHGVDSYQLAAYINTVAKEIGLFPKCFLQVNVGGEASKGGFEPEDLRSNFEQLLALDRLEIIGLMSIPPAGKVPEDSRQWFRQLRKLRDELQAEFQVLLPSLSMGMSGDYEVAIEEGATHVRVGSAIFGKRAYRVDGELG
jgi:PLP dependent protein